MPAFSFLMEQQSTRASTLTYRGRFAPSPTGALHFGSLLAAVGSYLDARSRGGEWIVRMENLDRNREAPGAADRILRTLERFGFEWDAPVLYQRHRDNAYSAALDRLTARGIVYPCACSRREVAENGRMGREGVIYAGTCRDGLPGGKAPRALRVRTPSETFRFHDRIQGAQHQCIEREVGDFVIRRADGYVAYQLAVVVDDAAQGVTHVVRGADLLHSTPRQILLQRLLDLPTPEYAHLPLAVDRHGRKLSKQHADTPVDADAPLPALLKTLHFLDQPLPPEVPANVREFWTWAIAHWDIERVPARHSRPLP